MEEPKQNLGIRIAVLDRGFVYVGRAAIDDRSLYLTDAQNIRRWGTNGGLGELAATGPTPRTQMDKTGQLLVPLKSLNHLIAVEESVWEKLL